MDDLLASIRKIIADDFGEPATPARDRADFKARPRPDPVYSEVDQDAALDARVAGAVSQAFAAAHHEIPPDSGPYDYSEYETVDEDAEPRAEADADHSEIMRTIASAIAAQREAPPQPGAPGWTRVILSEPGLDEPVEPPRAAPQPQPEPAAGNSPLERLAALKATLGTDDGRRAASAKAPKHQPAPKTDADEALPSNVYRLDPDQRTTDMSDTVADAQVHPEAQGNAFRRPPPQQPQASRAEAPDDGLTSQKTRQSVNQAFDSLSRTVLTNNPRTLEDLVRDMVRPLLREWLEANLGDIVERQVRQEIERVSTRGR